MYGGLGLDTDECSSDVVFEDPAAICLGLREVEEAFRALKYCYPEILNTPRIIKRTSHEGVETLVIYMSQKYFGFLNVCSTLGVSIQAGKILKFEERWNGKQFLDVNPIRFSRRINGVASNFFTGVFL